MKKTLSALALISLLAVLLVPMVASAQPKTQCTLKHDVTGIDTSCTKGTTVCDPTEGTCTTKVAAWGACCTLDAVYTATDWFFTILIVVVGLLIIWGAFDIVTAAGSTEKVSAGRNKILYALIGLAVALLAKAIPSVVKALLGV
jgi:hypothetical protein